MGGRQRKTRFWKEEGVKEEKEKAEESNGTSINCSSPRIVTGNFPKYLTITEAGGKSRLALNSGSHVISRPYSIPISTGSLLFSITTYSIKYLGTSPSSLLSCLRVPRACQECLLSSDQQQFRGIQISTWDSVPLQFYLYFFSKYRHL